MLFVLFIPIFSLKIGAGLHTRTKCGALKGQILLFFLAVTKFPLVLLAQHWALVLKVAPWVTEPLQSKQNAPPDAELGFFLCCHLRQITMISADAIHAGLYLSPKPFYDLDCLATTTKMPTSWQWHIQGTGSWVTGGRRWARGQLKFCVRRREDT